MLKLANKQVVKVSEGSVRRNFFICDMFTYCGAKPIKSFNVGSTYDMKKRLTEHNAGKVPATKKRRPLEVIYYEAFKNKYDAYLREKWLKTGWGRRYLRKTLQNTLKNLGG